MVQNMNPDARHQLDDPERSKEYDPADRRFAEDGKKSDRQNWRGSLPT